MFLMKENVKNTGLTPLERRIIGVCFDGVIKTNQQIADLVGTTEDSVKTTRASLKKDKEIIIPVRHSTPVKDLIIFHVWEGAETISELAGLIDVSTTSITSALCTLRRNQGIKIPLKRSKHREQEDDF